MPLTKVIGSGVGQLTSSDTDLVLQVKTAVDTSHRSTTSESFSVASNTAQVTITPRSASSRFFVTCSGCATATDGDDSFFLTIFRDSTNLGHATTGLQTGNSVPAVVLLFHPFCMTVLDSPSTASAITYGFQFRALNNDSDSYSEVVIGRDVTGSSNPMPTILTVMEIAG
tara:strand:+ start:98 stop:607 length:510 start_codon:yes stop_codon:yes gene_type:complete